MKYTVTANRSWASTAWAGEKKSSDCEESDDSFGSASLIQLFPFIFTSASVTYLGTFLLVGLNPLKQESVFKIQLNKSYEDMKWFREINEQGMLSANKGMHILIACTPPEWRQGEYKFHFKGNHVKVTWFNLSWYLLPKLNNRKFTNTVCLLYDKLFLSKLSLILLTLDVI